MSSSNDRGGAREGRGADRHSRADEDDDRHRHSHRSSDHRKDHSRSHHRRSVSRSHSPKSHHHRSHRHRRSSSRSRSPAREAHHHRSHHHKHRLSSDRAAECEPAPAAPVAAEPPVKALAGGAAPPVMISAADDFHRYSTHFRLWLKQTRSLLLFDLPRERARELFTEFAGAWNAGMLPRELYREDVGATALAAETVRTAHAWRFAPQSDAELDHLRTVGKTVSTLTNVAVGGGGPAQSAAAAAAPRVGSGGSLSLPGQRPSTSLGAPAIGPSVPRSSAAGPGGVSGPVAGPAAAGRPQGPRLQPIGPALPPG